MADLVSAFDSKDHNFTNVSRNNIIDHFFTQRKVIDYQEYIDTNMNRKKKKITTNYNFLALNFPQSILNEDLSSISIEIWGDKGYNYKGTLSENSGDIPHLLIRLKGDTQIFVKILLEKKNFTSFIQVPKRYQIEPKDGNSNVSE